MNGEVTPIGWLASMLDVAGRGCASHPFKVLKLEGDTAEVVHKESGAVWRFRALVVRRTKPVRGDR